MKDGNQVVLDVRDLHVQFQTRKGPIHAVNGVNIQVHRGEILALVGESGSGKSITSQAILRLVGSKKSECVTGSILLSGEELMSKTEKQMERIRGKIISSIFQDPMTSLNPVLRVGDQVAEVPRVHEGMTKRAAWDRAINMLDRVGIAEAPQRAKHYPHQFSGGMRQRGVIAMALASSPELLIADEPTTALDVTIQSQILDLLVDLSRRLDTAIVLITHDFGVVAEVCDTVAVMYAGRIVEQGDVSQIMSSPKHPYTAGLLASIPKKGSKARLQPIPGQPPSPLERHNGCAFAPRCKLVTELCRNQIPTLREVSAEHTVACWMEE